jgi:membrane protein implicated in regulation of membrane protease activity
VKVASILLFLSGLLLGVRVMFFGVQRRIDEERTALHPAPFAIAAFLMIAGALLYIGPTTVTPTRVALVLLVSLTAGAGAWWLVRRSAAIPSSDPEDDPRYRFQGHVARLVEPMDSQAGNGRLEFMFDGRQHSFRALWLPEGSPRPANSGRAGDEVVIERVDGDVAYVEPWAVVEERL